MVEFLKWTAWAMEKPTSYGAFHLIATVILLAITIFAVIKLKNTNDKRKVIDYLSLMTDEFLIREYDKINN